MADYYFNGIYKTHMVPKLIAFFCLIILSFQPEYGYSENNSNQKDGVVTWILNDLVNSKTVDRIIGKPKTVESNYGNALAFNGLNDGIFLDEIPLSNQDEFTIEAIFCPEKGGNFEQRFLHIGEISGDRVLLEIRTTATDWYFDAFVKSGEQQKTLIEPKYLHPLNQWYHVSLVVDHGKLTTYINSQKELEGNMPFTPIKTGKTSICVRLNEQSWFKGAIYKIRISPEALNPIDFMDY